VPFINKDLHKEKQYSYRKLINEFPNKNWNRDGLEHLINKIDEFDLILNINFQPDFVLYFVHFIDTGFC